MLLVLTDCRLSDSRQIPGYNLLVNFVLNLALFQLMSRYSAYPCTNFAKLCSTADNDCDADNQEEDGASNESGDEEGVAARRFN